jgi:hypothetical protein
MLSLCPFTLILDLHFSLQRVRLEVDQSILVRVNGPWVQRWTFREFNELQHNFERRMGPSYEEQRYLSLFGQNRDCHYGRILKIYQWWLVGSGSLGLCHD